MLIVSSLLQIQSGYQTPKCGGFGGPDQLCAPSSQSASRKRPATSHIWRRHTADTESTVYIRSANEWETNCRLFYSVKCTSSHRDHRHQQNIWRMQLRLSEAWITSGCGGVEKRPQKQVWERGRGTRWRSCGEGGGGGPQLCCVLYNLSFELLKLLKSGDKWSKTSPAETGAVRRTGWKQTSRLVILPEE